MCEETRKANTGEEKQFVWMWKRTKLHLRVPEKMTMDEHTLLSTNLLNIFLSLAFLKNIGVSVSFSVSVIRPAEKSS